MNGYRLYIVFVSSCFFFIFCKDNSEMLRLAKKTIEFFHDVLQRNVTAANPPPPNEHMTFLVVHKIDM